MKTHGKKLDNLFREALRFFVVAYRAIGSVHFGGGCRFQPSCSEYALEAIKLHDPNTAIRLITKRLLSCRPGGPFGIDDVPTVASHKGC